MHWSAKNNMKLDNNDSMDVLLRARSLSDPSGNGGVQHRRPPDEHLERDAGLGLSIDTHVAAAATEQPLEDRLQALEARLSRERELEDRVEELETKLSVLSRLLKLHNASPLAERKSLWRQQGTTTTLCGAERFRNTKKRNERMEEEHENNLPPPPPPPDTPPPPPPGSPPPDIVKEGDFWSSPLTRRDTAHNVPPLDSPASFLGKDRESARLSWHKETTRDMDMAPAFPVLEHQRTRTARRISRRISPSQDNATSAATDSASSIATPSTPTRSNRSTDADAGDLLPEQPPPTLDGFSAHKRNLSFRILYEGNEKAYQQGKMSNSAPPAQASMTLAERKWLGSLAQSISGEREQIPDDNVRDKWLNYLNSFQESTHDVDVQMEEFIKVPGQVEGIMTFGFFICIDSFLYCVTVLPIRFVWSCLLLLRRFLFGQDDASPAFTFHRRHSYQMIQVFILYCIYDRVLAPISIGQLYHWIRGQAMIKLYVLIAIVEVFDRLMCSMGQDCLDSMYWNTVNRPTSARMLISVLVVLVYCTIHTLFLFVHVATLNVAMNSADQALLTLLISGNFAEIKSTVFKKYNRPALFKLTASDICERFKLGLFLGLVLLLNYSQGMAPGQSAHFLRTCGFIWMAELIADWIKHSFITKFNFLPARVFVEYSLLLAGDVTGIGHENVNVDHSHAVVKRIGFAQLPFVCVMFRFVREAAKYAWQNEFWQSLSMGTVYGIFTASWLILVFIKVALGSFLHQMALAKLRAAPDMSSLTPKKKKKS